MKNLKRRDFLKSSLMGGLIPTFLDSQSLWSFGMMDEQLANNDNVLVVIQLSGGNDGINTVIPIDQYANYKAARTNIAIDESKLLKVPQSDKIGLNPGLKDFADLMKDGKASIVQDVGYPNPNFSHFRATDIWNTASSSNEVIETGWGGRYLSLQHPNFPTGYPNTKFPDPLAIQIGSVVTTAMQGPLYNMGMSISSATDFYKLLSNETDPTPNTLAGKELSYLREVAKQTNKYGDTIKEAALKVPLQKDYPNQSLANQLKIVARLIAGGLKTKIYYVRLGGFDTHSNQVVDADKSTGVHTNLLSNLSTAIKAFQDDLKFLKVQDKVLGMTYSEFGRRIKSNGSAGTDHGAAAPMFFFGEKVNANYFGNPTPISATVGAGDNAVMQYDFRAIYSSIMKYWFCSENAELSSVLFKQFEPLPLVYLGTCGYVTSTYEPKISRLEGFPNPFTSHINVKFESEGDYNVVQLFDMRGREILNPVNGNYSKGSHEVIVDTSQIPQGTYMIRFQNKTYQETKKVLKM